jgi:hypothetical protein
MRRLLRLSVAAGLLVSGLSTVGAPPAGALPPGPTCAVSVTGDGTATCLYGVGAGLGARTVTVTAAAGETAIGTVVCTVAPGVGAASVIGPGFVVTPFTGGGLCVLTLVATGTALATATGT